MKEEANPVKMLKVKKSQEMWLTNDEAMQLPAISNVPMSEQTV